MFTLFFVVVRKLYCLPTSFQNVGVASVVPTCMFTKFHASQYFGKRVTQRCIFTLFFVVVRKGCCLPTSYQNVGVVSVYPTCEPSFMHPSTLVRELHKFACPIVMYGPKLFIVVFQKVRCLPKLPCMSPKSIPSPSFICGCTPVSEIRKFNQKKKKKKKKMNNYSEKAFFWNLTPFP